MSALSSLQRHAANPRGSAFRRFASIVGLVVIHATSNSGAVVAQDATTPTDRITIAHIAAGIRSHIDRESRANGGAFLVEHDDKMLRLELIRIHMEYLANLGGGVQFACVDLVEQEGTVYDVDFFLAGTDPANLTVTETHVHKVHGRPLYAWEQLDDGTWRRVPAAEASEELLGVIRGEDRFEFTYRYTIPAFEGSGRLWLPLAQSDAAQSVSVKSIRAPAGWRIVDEPRHGNRVLYMEIEPDAAASEVKIRYLVTRREVSPYAADPSESPTAFLEEAKLAPVNDTFREIAREVTEGADTDLMRARAIYRHATAEIRYARYGDGWGKGDAVYACDVKRGNCSDFHAYFISLAQAAGIPARFIIGAAVPSERDDGGVDGYHCWAEFYAAGKWWPVDVSEANKNPTLADYYFGHHPANRFELSRGRDLIVEPAPQGGAINFLAYPVLEVDGVAIDSRPVFEFRRVDTPPDRSATSVTVRSSSPKPALNASGED